MTFKLNETNADDDSAWRRFFQSIYRATQARHQAKVADQLANIALYQAETARMKAALTIDVEALRPIISDMMREILSKPRQPQQGCVCKQNPTVNHQCAGKSLGYPECQ